MKIKRYTLVIFFLTSGYMYSATGGDVWTHEEARANIVGPYAHVWDSQDSKAYRKYVLSKWEAEHVSYEKILDVVVSKVKSYGQEINYQHWLLDDIEGYSQRIKETYGLNVAVDHLLSFADYMSLTTYKQKQHGDKEGCTRDKNIEKIFQDVSSWYTLFNAPKCSEDLSQYFSGKVYTFFPKGENVLTRFLDNGGFMHMAEYLALFAEGFIAMPMPNIKGAVHDISVHEGKYVGGRRMCQHDSAHTGLSLAWIKDKNIRVKDMKEIGDYIWRDIDDSQTVSEQHFKIFMYYELIHEQWISLDCMSKRIYIDGFLMNREYYACRKYFIAHQLMSMKEVRGILKLYVVRKGGLFNKEILSEKSLPDWFEETGTRIHRIVLESQLKFDTIDLNAIEANFFALQQKSDHTEDIKVKRDVLESSSSLQEEEVCKKLRDLFLDSQ